MSRAYRVKWQTASRTVRSNDAVELGVDLLGILPEDEMAEVLCAELKADGWKPDHGKLSKKIGSALATLSDDKKTITVTLKSSVDVTARAATLDLANKDAKRQEKALKSRLDEETARSLTKAEADLRDTLVGVVQRTYRVALERRARKLGDIESIQESATADGDVEITIKIKT